VDTGEPQQRGSKRHANAEALKRPLAINVRLKLIGSRNKGEVYVPSAHHLKRLGDVDAGNTRIDLQVPVVQPRTSNE
jgi:hypothetical protein